MAQPYYIEQLAKKAEVSEWWLMGNDPNDPKQLPIDELFDSEAERQTYRDRLIDPDDDMVVREGSGRRLSRERLARQLDEVLSLKADPEVTGHLIREIRGSYRDAALADLAAALKQAERNEALLSHERIGHRDAILRMEENATASGQKPTGAAPSPYGAPPEKDSSKEKTA